MKVQASAKFIRVSPRKMNIVAGLIRRKTVELAKDELELRKERAARLLLGVLESAAANAYENHSLDVAALTVASVTVGQGPRLKRFTPRAFGRATAIRKPTSHITVVVEGEKTVVKKAKARTAPKKSAATEEAADQSKAPAATRSSGTDREEKAPQHGPDQKGFLRRVFQRKSGM